MADKSFTYTNNFDGGESISGSLSVTVRPGQASQTTGTNTQIRDSANDSDNDNELILYSGRQVGGYAEFADERFDAVGGQPSGAKATSFTMTANVDIIPSNVNSSGNGQVDGFSFNFGRTSSLPAAGDGVTSAQQGSLEQGVSTGLSIRVMPFQQSIQIVWNGTVLNQLTGLTNLESLPAGQMTVSVQENGLVTVNFNGIQLNATIPSVDGKSGLAAADQADWGFSFAGRTGGNAGEIWIDDIALSGRIVCFTKGTMIATASGAKAVEDLQPGDLVLTRDHGLQPIRWAGHWQADAAKLTLQPALQPVLIRKGALGPDMPASDMMVSGQHRIMVASAIVERMFDGQEMFVAAKHLIGLPGVESAALNDGVTYYHILCDAHEIVWANGTWAETLLIAPEMYQSLPWSSVTRIFQLFPNLKALLDNPQPARPSMTRKQAAKMVQRHVHNDKPLVTTALASPKGVRAAG
ncbi:MAG: Hint domain-containing protein [Loktanella sp.]|nr:Hint domain-containing protein [Loktanella sp.]